MLYRNSNTYRSHFTYRGGAGEPESTSAIEDRLERSIRADLASVGGLPELHTGLRDQDTSLPYLTIFVSECLTAIEFTGTYRATVIIEMRSDSHSDGSPAATARGNHTTRWGTLLDYILTDPLNALTYTPDLDAWAGRLNDASIGGLYQIQVDGIREIGRRHSVGGKELVSEIEFEMIVKGENTWPV